MDLLEPDVIVFGGGAGELLTAWMSEIRYDLATWSINQRSSEIPILPAKYKDESGIVGAAALCQRAGGEDDCQ